MPAAAAKIKPLLISGNLQPSFRGRAVEAGMTVFHGFIRVAEHCHSSGSRLSRGGYPRFRLALAKAYAALAGASACLLYTSDAADE